MAREQVLLEKEKARRRYEEQNKERIVGSSTKLGIDDTDVQSSQIPAYPNACPDPLPFGPVEVTASPMSARPYPQVSSSFVFM